MDCPGHDILMATMLNGAAVMDGALLLIAANESCPQPQTSEHLAAVEIMRLKNLIIVQNKIDLVDEPTSAAQYESIRRFVQVSTTAPRHPHRCLYLHISTLCMWAASASVTHALVFSSNQRPIVKRYSCFTTE